MTATTVPFNALVAESIARHSKIAPENIIVLDNSDKYCPDGIKSKNTTSQQEQDEEESLAAIFDTMACLNRAALSDQTLCAGPSGSGPSFRSALLSATDELVNLAGGRPVRYVELGPEPWKSSAILTRLLDAGVQLCQYVGIDINPESEKTMRDALVPIIGEKRFAYLIADFYKITADDLPALPGDMSPTGSEVVTVMTNLGFQEGNDLPSRLGPMLTRLTKPGNLVLSEMQVLQDQDEASAVEEFYHLPEMLRFSSLVGKKFDPHFSLDKPEDYEYIFNLVPLHISEIGQVKVATTLVSVPLPDKKGKHYVLTNSCLKYTREQFERAREALGKFGVRACKETGDRSVVFQIAERTD